MSLLRAMEVRSRPRRSILTIHVHATSIKLVIVIIDCEHLYKEETGSLPVWEEELEFMVWRSKGQWVINISDAEKMEISGRTSFIRFTRTNPEYLEWLENKVMELLNQQKA